jgi:hypothetical protein
MSSGKLMIYTINGSKYCAKNECNTMIVVPRRHHHPSNSANRPADVAVTVNFNGVIILMVDDPIDECFSRDRSPEYCKL